MTYTQEDLSAKPTKKLQRLASFSGVDKKKTREMGREQLIAAILANPPKPLNKDEA